MSRIIVPPESCTEISRIAQNILRKEGALGVLPTPIDELIDSAKITDKSNQGDLEDFISTLSSRVKGFLLSGLQKIRGLADLRDRAIYVPRDTRPRERFAKSHEFGHEIIPWHNAFPQYEADDSYSLSPQTEKLFDQEANFFAAEIIFQGSLFRQRALSYRPSLEAVFLLADQHEASREATMRRYVEIQDETVAVVKYFPSRSKADIYGVPLLNKPCSFRSSKFAKLFPNIEIPQIVDSTHPWSLPRVSGSTSTDEVQLICDGKKYSFVFESWWNNYNLFVFLRYEPVITRIRKSLHLPTAVK